MQITRNKIYTGHSLEILKTFPDKSVHCCVTSPPYYGLRDYKIENSFWPAVTYSILGFEVTVPEMECCLGLESSPNAFVAHIVVIFREVKRVLHDDGTLWLNFGDSYCANTTGSQGNGKSTLEGGGDTQIEAGKRPNKTGPGLKPKDLIGVPWMVAFALRDDGWYLRQDIIWFKKNPMPESVTDRPTKAHEYIFLLSKSQNYYYDAEAIKEPASNNTHERVGRATRNHKSSPTERINGIRARKLAMPGEGIKNNSSFDAAMFEMPNKRNKRSIWSVVTQPFPEAHFATFPEDLIVDCIKAGSSEHGCCSNCGKPWERIIEPSENYKKYLGKSFINTDSTRADANTNLSEHMRGNKKRHQLLHHEGTGCADYNTIGWQPSCKCNAEIVPAVILDPFMGAGTTALVASKLNRNFIGFELNEQYIKIGEKRLRTELGMFNTLNSEV